MESNTNSSQPVAADTNAKFDGKLSVMEKVGYGLGDTASNILYQAWNFFLMVFYTDVFGISAKTASLMFLVTRIWDTVNDPVMGMIADRTNTRWGRFRPYLLWMAIPYGVLACAMFVTPDWGMKMKIFYAYASYILATMAYTAINIPYSSLMAVMTPDPHERTTLSQYRFFFAFVGGLLVTTFTLPLAKLLGANPNHSGYSEELGYSQALGYQMTMGVFGALAIVLLIITFLTTRERVVPSKEQKSSLVKDLKDITRNVPWIIIFIAAVFWLIYNMIRNGMVAYYFNNVNGEGEKVLLSLNLGRMVLDFNQTTVFLTINTLGMMAGVFISTPFKKMFGRKTLLLFFTSASVVLTAIFYVLPEHNFVLLSIVNFVLMINAGAIPVFIFAMFADVTDYHEWKFGQRATGLVIAGIMFAIKLGVAIGGSLTLFLLGQFGYDSDLPATPEVIKGIKLLFSVIPAGFMLVSVLVLFAYPISEKMLTQIEEDLKARNA